MRVSRFVQTSFVLAGLAALPLLAQTSADSNAGTAAPAMGTTATNNNYPQNRDQDRGFNYGWLGLIGLAGLSGLMRRSHNDQPHIADARTVGTSRA